MDVVKHLTEICIDLVGPRSCEIVNLSYKCEGKNMVLRLLVDKEDGITLDECSQINNELSARLEADNAIEESYLIEVSSPGLDKELISQREYEWALGKCVRVSLYSAIDGKDIFIGKLVGFNETSVVIQEKSGISTEIAGDKIAKIRRHIDFNLNEIK